ncbi:patatin-like phospholipase family protein [Chloroflexota bacterium]
MKISGLRPRRKINKKIGLALGGGAARGLAHIGVLSVLEEAGIPIYAVAGTSAGALVGALYANGKSPAEIKQAALNIGIKGMAGLVDLSLPKSGLIKGQKIMKFLSSTMGGDLPISELKKPFACTATDIETGDPVLIREGSMLEAVRASISIPAIFSLARYQGHYMADGGLSIPIPVDLARSLGADFVIGVNVLPDADKRANHVRAGRKHREKEPNIFHVLMQAMFITSYSVVQASLDGADFIIQPDTASFGGADIGHIYAIIKQGEIAALRALPELKAKLDM